MGSSYKKTRIFRTQSQWKSLLEKQASSGKSVDKFCNDEAISSSAFYRQRQILTQSTKSKSSNSKPSSDVSKSFIELTAPSISNVHKQVVMPTKEHWCVELQISDHMILRLRT